MVELYNRLSQVRWQLVNVQLYVFDIPSSQVPGLICVKHSLLQNPNRKQLLCVAARKGPGLLERVPFKTLGDEQGQLVKIQEMTGGPHSV